MSESYQLEEKLFTAAFALPAGERAAFLREACAGDSALRERVEALLRAHEESGGFLEDPPELELAEAARTARAEASVEAAGSLIGRYKLLEKIGEGGCGVVYLAEQAEPVRRRVALKIIKLGMDTKSVVARFEAERQALALMDHPNIARALDAGATDQGRPFFVMELVSGIRITDYCDQHRLSVEERLRLLGQVCHAVQHAHQKGVIHRDLKPSNILVATQDGVATPKVIDFGIAKATQGRLTDHTLFTAFEQFIGTPAYMSPEQAARGGLDVDTRSDLYSLGVLLYELLTGRTPLDTPELLRSGVDEVRRQIRETEAPRPSARLRMLDPAILGSTAICRRVDAPRLIYLVDGDLDWIATRCLEKDRTRRYETVNGLARDLERHLQNEPIQARPPGRVYVLRKFFRRHRLAFFTGGGVAAALLTGLTVSTVLFFREKAARDRAVLAEQMQSRLRTEAEANEKKAQSEAIRSGQVAQFMEGMLEGVGPSVARGRDTVLLREILDATALRLERELSDQPALQADMRETLVTVYTALGEHTKAEEMQRAVLAARRRLYGDESLIVAHSLNQLGDALTQVGKSPEAEGDYREALAIQRHQLKSEDQVIVGTMLGLVRCLLAQSLPPIDRKVEAEDLARQALAIQRRASGHPDAVTLAVFGDVLLRAHKYAEAETVFREMLAADPDNGDILYKLGDSLAMTHKLPEAETTLRRAFALQSKALNEGNPQLGMIQRQLSEVLRREGKLAEAEPVAREGVALRRKLLAREPANRTFLRALADSLTELGSILYQQERFGEAEIVDREALALHESAMGNINREGVDCLHRVGDDLMAEGRLEESEVWFRATLVVEGKVRDERVGDSIEILGDILTRQHRPVASDPMWAEAMAIATPTLEMKNPVGTAYVAALCMELVVNGKYAEAEPLVRGHLAKLERMRPDYWYIFAYRYLLGGLLAGQGKYAEAEPLLRSGYAGIMERRGVEIPPRSSEVHLYFAARFLAKLYTDWGRPADAAEWEQKARKFEHVARY